MKNLEKIVETSDIVFTGHGWTLYGDTLKESRKKTWRQQEYLPYLNANHGKFPLLGSGREGGNSKVGPSRMAEEQ